MVLTYTLNRLALALLLRRLLGLQLALHLADFSAGLPLAGAIGYVGQKGPAVRVSKPIE